MSSPYTLFKTDEAVENDGIWLNYGPFRIRIARAGGSNVRYAKAAERHAAPYKRAIKNGTLDREASVSILVNIYADAVILGWENVTGPDGKQMAYNRENVIKLLTDLPELFDDIQEQAGVVSNFRAEELEQDAKN